MCKDMNLNCNIKFNYWYELLYCYVTFFYQYRLKIKNRLVMRRVILFSALLLIMALTGCRERGVKGSGNVVTEIREIDDFTQFEVSGAYNIEIEVGSNTSLSVSAEDNLQKFIKTEVVNNRLLIENSRSISPKRKIKIVISTPSLREIESSGISNVYADGIDERVFTLDLSGAGYIELYGKVEQFNVELSGAGRLEAKELYARFISIDASGASNAEVYASERLLVDLSGTGTIEYYGDPEDVREDVSGLGNLVKGEF